MIYMENLPLHRIQDSLQVLFEISSLVCFCSAFRHASIFKKNLIFESFFWEFSKAEYEIRQIHRYKIRCPIEK